jgi:hypothetical protein
VKLYLSLTVFLYASSDIRVHAQQAVSAGWPLSSEFRQVQHDGLGASRYADVVGCNLGLSMQDLQVAQSSPYTRLRHVSHLLVDILNYLPFIFFTNLAFTAGAMICVNEFWGIKSETMRIGAVPFMFMFPQMAELSEP